MSNQFVLLADIGGTNARFALAKHDVVGFEKATTLQCADFSSATEAMRHYLDSVAVSEPLAVCLAAAGPVIDETLVVTNNHWTLSTAEICASLGVERVRLLNDFEAIARSLPHIESQYLEPVGSVSQHALGDEDFGVAIVGPGTGFGVSGLFSREGCLLPIVGEGGHAGFAPQSKVQSDILNTLRVKHARVCIEHLLSGPGVENIYWALQTQRQQASGGKTATQIFAAAKDGGDACARDAVALFFEVLGQVAGDIALTLGATDGVFIAGGITRRYSEMLHKSDFRNAFESKNDYRSLMERIPTYLMNYDEPGLLGAASRIRS